jgi:hypothetical protein
MRLWPLTGYATQARGWCCILEGSFFRKGGQNVETNIEYIPIRVY